MGQKIKPRQQASKPRSIITRDNIIANKGGPHVDKQEKRRNNPKNTCQHDWDDK